MTRKKRRRKDEQQRGGMNALQPHEIGKMRGAGRLAAELLDAIAPEIRAGMSTQDIDRMVDEMTRARGAISAPYRYHGFPGHCCTSINDVVCHGIPDPRRILRDGDIINVDVTPILDGFHGDASRTFMIGNVSSVAQRLVQDTYRSLWKGISAVRPGGTTGDIGYAIQSFVEPRGYSVVRQFSGHGIGRIFHTAPAILHYGRPGGGERLTPGMTFTIEPMINLGDWRCQISSSDGWTAVTVDGSLSAQFEHTVLVTETGVEVLTLGADEALQIEPPLLGRESGVQLAGTRATGSDARARPRALPAEQGEPACRRPAVGREAHTVVHVGRQLSLGQLELRIGVSVGHENGDDQDDDHDTAYGSGNYDRQVVDRRRAARDERAPGHDRHQQGHHHDQPTYHLRPPVLIDGVSVAA